MLGTEIAKINALEILDSRAAPTVFCKVTLACGAQGCAAVPSGASRGKNEAFEKRDGGERFGGRGVEDVCRRMERELFKSINGADAANQKCWTGFFCGRTALGIKGITARTRCSPFLLPAHALRHRHMTCRFTDTLAEFTEAICPYL